MLLSCGCGEMMMVMEGFCRFDDGLRLIEEFVFQINFLVAMSVKAECL